MEYGGQVWRGSAMTTVAPRTVKPKEAKTGS